MQNFWNDRYSSTSDFIYGKEPNEFFKSQIDLLKPGKILLPCDGEGRNGVYAARIGWDVFAFDQSMEGQKKAMSLAKEYSVGLNYEIADALAITYLENSFDAIALIFSHLPTAVREKFHAKAISWLKPGGTLILEAYNPLQLNNNTGGPKDVSMLYTPELMKADFGRLSKLDIKTEHLAINEGEFHSGISDVIRVIGVK
ncbi:MAG: class I SAM-dependent methyltransferase [Bacteroidia bacterium]